MKILFSIIVFTCIFFSAQGQDFHWAQAVDIQNCSVIRSVDGDPFGNVYTVGRIGALLTPGGSAFISKHNSAGNLVWLKLFNSTIRSVKMVCGQSTINILADCNGTENISFDDEILHVTEAEDALTFIQLDFNGNVLNYHVSSQYKHLDIGEIAYDNGTIAFFANAISPIEEDAILYYNEEGQLMNSKLIPDMTICSDIDLFDGKTYITGLTSANFDYELDNVLIENQSGTTQGIDANSIVFQIDENLTAQWGFGVGTSSIGFDNTIEVNESGAYFTSRAYIDGNPLLGNERHLYKVNLIGVLQSSLILETQGPLGRVHTDISSCNFVLYGYNNDENQQYARFYNFNLEVDFELVIDGTGYLGIGAYGGGEIKMINNSLLVGNLFDSNLTLNDNITLAAPNGNQAQPFITIVPIDENCLPYEPSLCSVLTEAPSIVDCSDGSFLAEFELDVEESSDSFELEINGNSAGVFDYADSPFSIGPYPADGSTMYSVVISDSSIENCNAQFSFVAPDCTADNIPDISLIDAKVYPNPSNSLLHYSIPLDVNITEILLLDQTGRIVIIHKPLGPQGEIDILALKNGVYSLVLSNEGTKIITKKIVKF